MGLFERFNLCDRFNFWKKQAESLEPEDESAPLETVLTENNPSNNTSMTNGVAKAINGATKATNGEYKGIEKVYAFLQADYESKGYADAISNPDDNYKIESIKLLKMDLEIILQQAFLYYDELSREIEVHIRTRSNAGLIDLVEELNARKAIIDEHKRILSQIKEDVENEKGKFLRVKICYERGFLKGLMHLTNTNILNKKIS